MLDIHVEESLSCISIVFVFNIALFVNHNIWTLFIAKNRLSFAFKGYKFWFEHLPQLKPKSPQINKIRRYRQ